MHRPAEIIQFDQTHRKSSPIHRKVHCGQGSTTTVNCIGLGHWGPNLVQCFNSSERATVRTVCDLSDARLAMIRKRFSRKVRTSTDPLATAVDPKADAIVIATPTQTHFELTKAALKAGKHVFVEKPLAGNLDEAEELVELANKQDRLLAVGHVFLFNNGIRAVKRLIDGGDLGHVLHLCATRTNLGPIRSDCNALWDLGAHDVSIFNYWLGGDPQLVTACGTSCLRPGIEDLVVANFFYPNNVQASVLASWLSPKKVREITVVGERQMVVWNDMELDEPIRIYHKSVDIERGPNYADNPSAHRMLVRTGDVIVPKIEQVPPLENECQHFLDCLEGKCLPLNDGEVGLRVVRALAAAEQSLHQGSLLVRVASPSGLKVLARAA
jgi:predicted dehydrogenase